MNDFLYRLSNYFQYYQYISSENSTSQTDYYFDEHINITLHYNSTNKDSFHKIKLAPLLSVKYFLILFIIVAI